jgi:hypothetical protein
LDLGMIRGAPTLPAPKRHPNPVRNRSSLRSSAVNDIPPVPAPAARLPGRWGRDACAVLTPQLGLRVAAPQRHAQVSSQWHSHSRSMPSLGSISHEAVLSPDRSSGVANAERDRIMKHGVVGTQDAIDPSLNIRLLTLTNHRRACRGYVFDVLVMFGTRTL